MVEKGIYGLLGRKLGHSLSPRLHNPFLKERGIKEPYRLFEISEIDDFPLLLKKQPEIRGLNVTVPYKESVMPYLDEIDSLAKEAGAVNVIKIKERDGKRILKGFNTDVSGFSQSIKPLIRIDEEPKALILGTGGAAKAVGAAFRGLGVRYRYVSRSPEDGQLGYDELTPVILQEFDIIVNATPLGMYPDVDKYPPLPYSSLSEKHLCFDLIYNPEETEFLRRAREAGARTKNGLEMLELQAEGSRKIWFDNEI